MAYASEKGPQVNPYADPVPAPTNVAQADAGNVQGQQNRERVGLSGYGGRTSEQLNQINQQTEQERQQKSQQEQDRLNYEQRARVNAGNRPGYYDESTIGDTRTQNFLKMRDQLAMVGMPVPDEDVFLGGVLEGQRKIAVTTPGTRDDQFFTNELTKWNHNPIELSSAYHDVGMNAGAPIPANPFENRGDVALAFEKSGNQRDFTVDRYGFNPNVGNMINTLPNGQGLQETSWTVAKTGQPVNVDFQPAIDYQVSQKGKYGQYGYLEGGIVDKVDVSVPVVREPAGTALKVVPGVAGNGVLKKDWNSFVASAAEPIGYISEGIQIPKTEKPIVAPQVANPNGSFMENALAGKFTPEQEKMLEPIKGISQTISGGVNFAFSIPVGIAAMIPFSPIKPWAPKDLEVVEKSKDPLKETIIYGEPTRTISGGNETITNLGASINQDKSLFGTRNSEIDVLLKGKVVDGKYTGSPEGYAIVSDKISKQNALSETINKNVGTYNEMQRQNPIVETTTTPQTVITSGTPDKVYAFGYWQKASEEFGSKAMGALGYNREQLDMYGETLKSKPGVSGELERFTYNVMKPAISSPMDLPVYYLEGKMIAGAVSGVGGTVTNYGQQGTGRVATTARILTTPGEGGVTGAVARTVAKWSLPVALTTGMGYEATNKGTDFSKETVLTNLESGVIPMSLMTYGAIGSEPVVGATRRGYNYASTRFQEKPMIIESLETRTQWTQQRDISVPSGIGGEIRIAETKTVAMQPEFSLIPNEQSVLGKKFTFPRIFEPVEQPAITKTFEGYGDTGNLVANRLEGATSNPTAGTRIESSRVEMYRGPWEQTGPYQYDRPGLTRGTGTLNIEEVRLPRTFDDYIKMGTADAKLTGEDMTYQLMMDAARVTEPSRGYRQLDVNLRGFVPAEEAFNWNVAPQGGRTVEFNRINPEDYFRSMKVSQTGSGKFDFTKTVERDVTEEGFMQEGNYDVTGAETPETKIVRQLQETSRTTEPSQVERGYGFNSRGELVRTVVGDESSVDYWPAKQDVARNVGDIGYAAHSHPYDPFSFNRILDDIRFDLSNLEDPTLSYTRRGLRLDLMRGAAETIPSRNVIDPDTGHVGGDINTMLANTPRALSAFGMEGTFAGEYIVSKQGVTIFRPDPVKGWSGYRAIKNLPEINVFETGVPRFFDILRSTGADIEFVGANKPFTSRGYTERITDVSGEMQAAYPRGFRERVIDVVDRMSLKDPNLEFVREIGQTPEIPLSESGSNLGGGTGGGGRGGFIAQTPIALMRQPITEQRVVGAPAQILSTPTATPSSPLPQISKQATEPVTIFGQASSQKPQQINKQNIEPKFLIEPVKAFSQPSMQVPQTRPAIDRASIFKVAVGVIPTQANIVKSNQDVWQTPIQSQRQTPIQTPVQLTRTIDLLQPKPVIQQGAPSRFQEPPIAPVPGLPFIPFLPQLPGGGGGTGTRRRGRKFAEYFPMGILAGVQAGYGLKTPKLARPKKGKLISKSMLSPVKRKKK